MPLLEIATVAEKVKEDLEEKSHIISKPSEQNKVPKEIINQPAAKVQSTTSKAPAMKPFETIELTKIESGSTIPVIKQCPTMTLSTKKIDPNVEKRFETTFPAEMGSEPTVSEVTRRFEGTASKKELEPVVSGAVNRLKDKGSETIESVFTAKVKQSQPIAQEVKPMITKASLSLKKADEKLDVDSIPDDIVVLPTREETRLSVSQDWSDEQEAGGLPRTESISSRMSRAVRQLFCCGVTYSPPSEDDIFTTRLSSGI